MQNKILETKLVPPSTRRELVRREHLSARIADIPNKRLTLVTAPAGYGKTSVLAVAFRELRAAGHAPGWVSLDGDDNDLSLFLTYWLAAMRPNDPHFGQGVLALLNADLNVPTNLLTAEFINGLHAIERDTYIFSTIFISFPIRPYWT